MDLRTRTQGRAELVDLTPSEAGGLFLVDRPDLGIVVAESVSLLGVTAAMARGIRDGDTSVLEGILDAPDETGFRRLVGCRALASVHEEGSIRGFSVDKILEVSPYDGPTTGGAVGTHPA